MLPDFMGMKLFGGQSGNPDRDAKYRSNGNMSKYEEVDETYFLPVNYQRGLLSKLQDLKQGNKWTWT